MISCPDCQAENEAGAKTCQACGKELPVAAPAGELPLWLRALKPDHLKESETDTIVSEPVAVSSTVSEPVAVSSAVPLAAMAHVGHGGPDTFTGGTDTLVEDADTFTGGTAALAEGNDTFAGGTDTLVESVDTLAGGDDTRKVGTDTLVATQPTPAARPVTPEPIVSAEPRPSKSSAKPSSAASNETASLISEDDLPAWLRAFSENDSSSKSASADDQSWMLGTAGETPVNTVAENLAQSWQAPTRTAPRTSAAAVFAVPTETAAKVSRVEKPERAIAMTPILVEPEPAPVMAAAKPTVPARLGVTRPAAPAATKRAGSSAQRIAVIAFLVALVVFLIVLGIFVILPALT